MKRVDEKLARIRAGQYTRQDFIIADAKDPDMGPSIWSTGPKREADGSWNRYRTRAEFLDQVRAIVEQDIVDVMLMSPSNVEKLSDEGLFANSAVKPVIRANDTTESGSCAAGPTHAPSRPFRSAVLSRTMYGTLTPAADAKVTGTDLGLYSVTFNNDIEADVRSLEAFAQFRAEAAAVGFKYFLEVFNPNVACGIDPEVLPHYINDCIHRCLGGCPFGGPTAVSENRLQRPEGSRGDGLLRP